MNNVIVISPKIEEEVDKEINFFSLGFKDRENQRLESAPETSLVFFENLFMQPLAEIHLIKLSNENILTSLIQGWKFLFFLFFAMKIFFLKAEILTLKISSGVQKAKSRREL